MAYLRLLINGRSFEKALSIGNADRRLWALIDAFRDRMLGDNADSMVYEKLCSVVFFDVTSIKEFVNSLEELYRRNKIREENYDFLLNYLGGNADGKVSERKIKKEEVTDFDIYLDDLISEDGLDRIYDFNSSYQFLISRGSKVKMSEYERDWLQTLKSKELLVSDMYLFQSRKINSELSFARAILNYLNRIKSFFALKENKRVLFLFNSYELGKWMSNELNEAIEEAKLEYEDGLFDSCDILLINLNERGRAKIHGKREETVRGVFHRRQLLTTRVRALFDTQADISSDRVNSFDMHPLYYDFEGTRKTGRNQFRGVYLPHFIFYLKKVIPNSDMSVNEFLESMECFKRFEEVYGNINVLQKKYRTQLNFKHVKVSLLES